MLRGLRICKRRRFPASIGFVNGVKCSNGPHMDLVFREIQKIVLNKARVKSKNPDLNVKPAFVKNEFVIVVNTLIPNPKFTSQTKDTLDTPMKNFKWTWEPNKNSGMQSKHRPSLKRQSCKDKRQKTDNSPKDKSYAFCAKNRQV